MIKAKERINKMKNSFLMRTLLVLTILLLSAFFAAAQSKPIEGKSYPPGPCHQGTKVCVQNMNKQISLMRAYVQRLKPGDKVAFNPQPDPPGNPDPGYRRAHQAYITLRGAFADLSESSPWGRSKWTWSQEQIQGWHHTISDAQDKLNSLTLPAFGRTPDSINETLDSLSASVRQLSNALATPQRGR
jgi:hypothetical protein